ncbi:MAG: hypothetical protein DHS20C05_20310 [Hyphococcus sp.]|nr:MAG: hypothetical protein DHS20C05_20310 [Marinicaulis sp.]
MNQITKSLITLLAGAGIFMSAQAAAEYRPDYCPRSHDHRSHNTNYYDYYEQDDYYRAGDYRGRRSDNRYDRGYDDYYRPRSKVVHRQTYRTQYRARIVLVEEIYWTRSGRKQLVCSVLAKGREAYYVPQRRMRRIANRDCSRNARIQFL